MNGDLPAPAVSPWSARQVFRGTLLVVGVALCFLLLYQNRGAVFSLFLAIVISTAISPMVDWLRRRGLPAGVGLVLIYLTLVIAIVALILLIVTLLTVQGPTLVAAVESLYSLGLAGLRQSPSVLVQRLATQLPATLQSELPAGAAPDTLGAFASVLAYLGLIGDGLFISIAVLLLAFYWTLDRERLVRWLLLLVRIEHRDPARNLLLASEEKVGAYIRGVALLCAIVGGLAFLAYWLIGLPNALLLGLLAGLLELVPIVGPALGVMPAVAVALTTDPSRVVWVLLSVGAIQLVENTYLAPRVLGRSVGVHPVVTLLSLAAFTALFGLPGALMAVPLAAVIQLLLDHFVIGPSATEVPIPAGRDRVSVLRYDTQELVRDIRKQARQKEVAPLGEEAEELEDKLEALATELDELLAQTVSEAGSTA